MPTLPLDATPDVWRAEDLEALGQCPVCHNPQRTPLHGKLTDRLFGCAPGQWQFYTCAGCEIAYIDPRPTPASIGQAYSSYFTHHEAPVASKVEINRSKASRRLGLRQTVTTILNGYRNARWHTQLSPSKWWGALIVPFLWPVRSLLVAHMRHLPPRPPFKGARLLDVGCGSGAFLEMAKAAGWEVQGVDFDPTAVAAARSRGLNVQCGGLEQLQGQISFDCLTCSHVIEHVHDPRQWLEAMHGLLRPHGWLWLQTPNIASIGHAHFGPDWRDLDPPRHLTLFTPEALTALLASSGFQVRLLTLPLLMAIPVYDASRNLAKGQPHTDGFAWRSLAHPPSLWRAWLQSLSPHKAEFITVVATRIA